MPWYNGDYPPSYKNQPKALREKAVEIANGLLQDGAEEGIAIATGLKCDSNRSQTSAITYEKRQK